MYGFTLEAEYESGLVLTEGPVDVSPYSDQDNFRGAIHKGEATKTGHRLLVRLSLTSPAGVKHDIDWTGLRELNCVGPIFRMKMSRSIRSDGTGDTGPTCLGYIFGYQYRDATGSTVEVVEEIE